MQIGFAYAIMSTDKKRKPVHEDKSEAPRGATLGASFPYTVEQTGASYRLFAAV